MISVKTQKETVEGKKMHVVVANTKCDEPGCSNGCTVKLSTLPTPNGVVWQVEESPDGWIVSMRHATCPDCAKKNQIVLIYDDCGQEASPEKVQMLVELQNRIAALRNRAQLDTISYPTIQSSLRNAVVGCRDYSDIVE